MYTILSLCIHPLTDISVAPIFWLQWIMLLWTWVSKYLLEILISFLQGLYSDVGLLDKASPFHGCYSYSTLPGSVCFQTRIPAPKVHAREKQKSRLRDFPGGPVVKKSPFKAEDTSSIPDQGTKISYAVQCSQKKILNKKSSLRLSRNKHCRRDFRVHSCTSKLRPLWVKSSPALLVRNRTRSRIDHVKVTKPWTHTGWGPAWLRLRRPDQRVVLAPVQTLQGSAGMPFPLPARKTGPLRAVSLEFSHRASCCFFSFFQMKMKGKEASFS